MLAAPAVDEYEPFVPYREQEDFILRWYALDPQSGRFVYRRGLYGRPRGHGKSPLLAALCVVEALADVVPDGWDADGQPVGGPWRSVGPPAVPLGAGAEEPAVASSQTASGGWRSASRRGAVPGCA